MLAKIKWYLLLGAIVFSLGGVLYYSLSELFTARETLRATQAQVTTLNERIAKMESHAKAAQDSAKQSGQVRGDVDAALSKERAWGDAPVPGGVAERLCQHLSCTGGEANQVQPSGH